MPIQKQAQKKSPGEVYLVKARRHIAPPRPVVALLLKVDLKTGQEIIHHDTGGVIGQDRLLVEDLGLRHEVIVLLAGHLVLRDEDPTIEDDTRDLDHEGVLGDKIKFDMQIKVDHNTFSFILWYTNLCASNIFKYHPARF